MPGDSGVTVGVGVGGGGVSVTVGSTLQASAAITAAGDLGAAPAVRRMVAASMASLIGLSAVATIFCMAGAQFSGVSDLVAAATAYRMGSVQLVGNGDAGAAATVYRVSGTSWIGNSDVTAVAALNQAASAILGATADMTMDAMSYRMAKSAPVFSVARFAITPTTSATQSAVLQPPVTAFLGTNMATRKPTRGLQYGLIAEFIFNIADSMVNVNGVLTPFNAAAGTIFESIPLPPNAVVTGGDLTVEVASDDTGAATIAIGDSVNNARYLAATSLKAAGRSPLVPTGYRGLGENIRMTLANAGGNGVNGTVSLRVHYIITGRAQETCIV